MIESLLNKASEDVKNNGLRGLANTASSAARFARDELRYLQQHRFRDVNIYDREWDLLILLDCATTEMMSEVQDEYNFIDEVGEHTTPGTCSSEWMRRTFRDSYAGEMKKTVHITANTSSERYLSTSQFGHLEEVWRDGWDPNLGTIPPREVTKRAVHYCREHDPERVILHYMQPHLPFVDSEIESNSVSRLGNSGEGMTLNELHEAGYSRSELWAATIGNLRYVLDDIRLLLSNADADRVVLSADHGQAFGEQGVWGHPRATYIDVLATVPWCVTSAEDSQTYTPDYDPTDSVESGELDVQEKLAALGYR